MADDPVRSRLRCLAHLERTELTTAALDEICCAFFGLDTGWHTAKENKVELACRNGLPASHFGTAICAYLTPYQLEGRLEDGALVIIHDDDTRAVFPYEACEDVVILLYRFFNRHI